MRNLPVVRDGKYLAEFLDLLAFSFSRELEKR